MSTIPREAGATPEAETEPAVGDEAGSKERLALWNLQATQWLGMRIPRPLGLLLARGYFEILFRKARGQREVVTANLARVLGHPPDSPLVKTAVHECFVLYGRYWYETFALRRMPPAEVNRRFSLKGRENIDRALEAGRGLLVALPHMGNWDAAGHWLALNGYKFAAVAEELKPAGAYDLFYRHRRALGMTIVPLSENRRAGETLARLLSENYVVTLVADRDLTRRGVEVEMFGASRRLPAGPAYLSLLTGSPLSAAVITTTRDGWRCEVTEPLEIERTGEMRADVAALTRRVSAEFERFISSAPIDWHMFQPAWEEGEVASGEPVPGEPGSTEPASRQPAT